MSLAVACDDNEAGALKHADPDPTSDATSDGDGDISTNDEDASQDPEPSYEAELALVNGQFLTMTTDDVEWTSDQALLIDEGRFKSFVDSDDIADDVAIVDLEGNFALPGLIDTHVHLMADEDTLNQGLGPMLDHGITTIRSLGDRHPLILELRDAIDAGDLRGPRLHATGPLLTAYGGHPISTFFDGDRDHPVAQEAVIELEETEQAEQVVENLASDGVDAVKVIYEKGSDNPALTREILDVLVDTAHQHDLSIVAHVDHDVGAVDALEAGVDGLEHPPLPSELDDEAFEGLLDGDFVLVPTAAVYEQLLGEETILELLSSWLNAGVSIAMGTDSTVLIPFGESLHRELELYVEAGMPPYEAYQTTTVNAAKHLGVSDELGRIAPGYLADLVVFENHPIDDLGDLGDPVLVLKNGAIEVNAL